MIDLDTTISSGWLPADGQEHLLPGGNIVHIEADDGLQLGAIVWIRHGTHTDSKLRLRIFRDGDRIPHGEAGTHVASTVTGAGVALHVFRRIPNTTNPALDPRSGGEVLR